MLLKKKSHASKSQGPFVCYSLNSTITFFMFITLLVCAFVVFVVFTAKYDNPSPPPNAAPIIQYQTPTPKPTVCTPSVNALTRLRNSYVRDSFQRIGHLVCETSKTIKPLYGRPLDRRSNKWHYYTSEHIDTNLNEIVQLAVIVNNRECMNDWGCDELYDNDAVNVESNSNTFRVKLYKQLL